MAEGGLTMASDGWNEAIRFSPSSGQPRTGPVAIFPWSDLIEDFLDSIGISFEKFRREMTGGWLFGYVEALKTAGIGSVIFCVSARHGNGARFVHEPTGAPLVVLPASRLYLRLRREMLDPYGLTLAETFGKSDGLRRVTQGVKRAAALYLNTPLPACARALRRERCAAILCQEYEYSRFDISVLLGRAMGIPVFATFQGGTWKLSPLEKVLRPLSLKACAGLIIASGAERDRVLSQYPSLSRRIGSIFNPLDMAPWQIGDRAARQAVRATVRRELDIPEHALVVVWHGRVDIHRKGLDLLMEAWKGVRKTINDRDVRLLLVGTGDDRDRLAGLIEGLGLEGVSWIDEYVLDRQRIRDYLIASDLSVLPSRHEGFPVAPLEAMACSLPVAATSVPGIPDIFQGGAASGGFIVPPDDTQALAKALILLLSRDDLRRGYASRARKRVESAFSPESVGGRLKRFFFDRL